MCIVCMHLCVCLVCSLWFTVTMSNGFIEVYGFWYCFIASKILFPTNSSVLVCLSSVYHCICVAYRFCGPTVQMKFRTGQRHRRRRRQWLWHQQTKTTMSGKGSGIAVCRVWRKWRCSYFIRGEQLLQLVSAHTSSPVASIRLIFHLN